MKSKICSVCWRIMPENNDLYAPEYCDYHRHLDESDWDSLKMDLNASKTAMKEVEFLLWTIFGQAEILKESTLDGIGFNDAKRQFHQPIFNFIVPEYRLVIDFITEQQILPAHLSPPDTDRPYLWDKEELDLRNAFIEAKATQSRNLNYRWLCLRRNATEVRNDLIRYVNEFYILQQRDHINLLTPKLQGDAGWDIVCDSEIICPPQQGTDIPSDLYLEIPNHLYAIVQARSSTSKRRLLVLPGVIDPSYRGRIYVMAYNLTSEPITVKAGERIAQLLFFPRIPHLHMQPVTALRPSERGDRGFGSTGT